MQKPVTSLLPLSFNMRIVLIILSCIALNLNTINHEYALDDNIVIVKNMNVNNGFGGIGEVLGTDAFQGFLDYAGANMPIAGGRYRPLSIVSFAIETGLFTDALGGDYLEAKKTFLNLQAAGAPKEQVEAAAKKVRDLEKEIDAQNLSIAPIRHGFQIAWFTLSMVVLFIFLYRYLLPHQPDVALITTLLFVFHPIHTEVIANIKSRDEIFSLLFITLSCMYVFRYIQSKKSSDLLLLLLFTLLAMLSKEYAMVLPVIAFAAVYLTQKTDPVKIITSRWFMLMLAVIAIMMLVRYNIVIRNRKVSTVTDVLNDPFMYATLQQKIATKIAILDQYLRLLVFPYPLSSDYSYNHYPYLTFADWQVWLSILIWGAIVYITVKLWHKKHFLAFPLVFFFAFFMLVNNLLFDIGATMGERLVYHSSIGFCLIVAWLLINKLPVTQNRGAVIYGMIMEKRLHPIYPGCEICTEQCTYQWECRGAALQPGLPRDKKQKQSYACRYTHFYGACRYCKNVPYQCREHSPALCKCLW
jgi:protein O-mannosyl-transferase